MTDYVARTPKDLDGWDNKNFDSNLNHNIMENTTKEYEPAFPTIHQNYDGSIQHLLGMTLRDYFATEAMKYFINANNGNFSEQDARQIFYIADTMLTQRSKP